MIVALHLERHSPAIADIDHARIFFAGLDQNVWTGGGKFPQFFPRIFIRAMLTPHHGENSELGEIRLATQDFLDPFKLLGSQTVSFDQLWCDHWIGGWRFATHWQTNLTDSPSPLNDNKTANNSNTS